MSRIESIATDLPPNVIPQELAKAAFTAMFSGHPEVSRLAELFDRCGVEQRHFSFPPDYYLADKSFDERNRDYIAGARDLAERAARECLREAGVEPERVDHLILVTTTGLATPSLDALLVPRLGLRPDVRRWPLFGLGCAGGAGALVRAEEILRGGTDGLALVISVELCGQSFTRRANDPVDAVGGALFGDGAVALLVSSSEASRGGPSIVARRSVLFENSEQIMGWRFTSDGMRLVLSREITDLLKRRFRPVVQEFLASAGMTLRDITYWVLHPGGRRIVEAYQQALDCPAETLAWARNSLARVGNLSSASVLFVLADVFHEARPRSGEKALVAAPGPGFGMEMLVLEW